MAGPDDLVAVAATGDRRLILEAMRDRAASELDAGPPPHAVAPLLREMANILSALDALPVREASFLDDLERRRADRESAATAS